MMGLLSNKLKEIGMEFENNKDVKVLDKEGQELLKQAMAKFS